jgi:Integrase zinc binding domain
MHDSHVRGHSGMLGTYQRAKGEFCWPMMKEKIVTHVRGCEICQLNKHETKSPPRLLEPIAKPEVAWQVITIDFICGMPKSENKEVIMVVIDKFTKFDHFIHLFYPYTLSEVARVFLKNIYKLHGYQTRSLQIEIPYSLVYFRKR